MNESILNIIAKIIAGIIIMILHELPKSIVFKNSMKDKSRILSRSIYKVIHYVDPIGLLLFITTYTGFSKPYMYRIKDRNTNTKLGVTGFISLLILYLGSLLATYYFFYDKLYNADMIVSYSDTDLFFFFFLRAMMLFSINMFIVNLFPVSTFDLGLVIAGRSPKRYFSIIRGDFIIKILLIFSIIIGIIPTLGSTIARYSFYILDNYCWAFLG